MATFDDVSSSGDCDLKRERPGWAAWILRGCQRSLLDAKTVTTVITMLTPFPFTQLS